MMPSPLVKVRDQLPDLIEQAEVTLRTFGAIVARMPDSLDRSDQFFTNVERAMREADLPALSADSREVLHDDERADRADVFQHGEGPGHRWNAGAAH